MPLVRISSYRPPVGFRNPHLQTVFPAIFRRPGKIQFVRERLELPDGDFIDLDITGKIEEGFCALLLHGLEGSSRSSYMRGMAQTLQRAGLPVVAMNFRGCSGEPNRLACSYHGGQTSDLAAVVDWLVQNRGVEQIFPVGFSLGGNVLLRYLANEPHEAIRRSVAISVPCDLESSNLQLQQLGNRLYSRRFVRTLRGKLQDKSRRQLTPIEPKVIRRIRNVADFDAVYTAPAHGFSTAADYWAQCSSRPVVEQIALPTLVINALDDPFLAEECYPFAEAEQSRSFYLETPRHGGHIGFVTSRRDGFYWHELRAWEFLRAGK